MAHCLNRNNARRGAALEQGLVKKYTSLIDFGRLNYLWSHVVILSKTPQALIGYLMKHPNVNNLYRLDDGSIYAETVFPTMARFHAFLESLQDYDLISIEEYYIIQALGQEMMLSEKRPAGTKERLNVVTQASGRTISRTSVQGNAAASP